MWWYFVISLFVIVIISWFYFNSKIKQVKHYPYVFAMTIGMTIYILDSNINWFVEWLNKKYSLGFPLPSQLGNFKFFLLLVFILVVLYLLSRTNTRLENNNFKEQKINMPNNNGKVHIEQHQHIYTYQQDSNDEAYEDSIEEEDAKRSIENINHLEFIKNLGNEKRIALVNAHKKWDTGISYKMREGNDEFIEFLENVWLQLSEFYTSRNFDGKSPKQYIEDYIQERSEYHHSKHIIDGQFLGGSDTRLMIGADIMEDLETLIKDMIFTFSTYNDDFDYESWEKEWNIEHDDNGRII